jgi:hypothetical protein
MKCAVHTDVDATGYCRNCGRAMCSTCVRPVHDVLYCEDCLAGVMGHSPAPRPQAPPPPAPPPAAYYVAPGVPPAGLPPRSASSPPVAFILGFVPGLGAVYNGEYNKALIHVVVFAIMILGLSSDMDGGLKAMLGILLGGFVIYMAFDAMRTAKAKSIGEAPVDPLEDWSKNRPIGPIILIGLGALFLLNNFHVFDFFRIREFWLLVLIGVGILMFRKRLTGN